MSDLLKKPAAAVTKEERDQAKVVSLGLIYGMGGLQVSKKLGISVHQANTLTQRFFATYPG
jgi:DNA polymerase-1